MKHEGEEVLGAAAPLEPLLCFQVCLICFCLLFSILIKFRKLQPLLSEWKKACVREAWREQRQQADCCGISLNLRIDCVHYLSPSVVSDFCLTFFYFSNDSLYLFKLGLAPQIQDLYGKVDFTGELQVSASLSRGLTCASRWLAASAPSSLTEEEINNMKSELEKYGIQMPAFSKIGGILANELSVDEAARERWLWWCHKGRGLASEVWQTLTVSSPWGIYRHIKSTINMMGWGSWSISSWNVSSLVQQVQGHWRV